MEDIWAVDAWTELTVTRKNRWNTLMVSKKNCQPIMYDDGLTVLMGAVKHGGDQGKVAVHDLLSICAPQDLNVIVNAQNECKKTALMYATRYHTTCRKHNAQAVAIMRMLIESEADVNLQDSD